MGTEGTKLMKRIIWTLIFSVVWFPPLALAQGDPTIGAEIVYDRQRHHCAQCHVGEPSALKTALRAPSFREIANEPERYTIQRLRLFLKDPHHPMGTTRLSHDEIENVIAYIRSLSKRP